METVFLSLSAFLLFMLCVLLVIFAYATLVEYKRSTRFRKELEARLKAGQKEHDEMKRRIRKELGYDSK